MGKELQFYEFFAGGGMARAGLGDEWRCLLANDVAQVKIDAYKAKWGSEHLDTRDINELSPKDLPAIADLAWASFPCQDLSVAGNGRGIGEAGSDATRSGALWPFLNLIEDLRSEGRHPRHRLAGCLPVMRQGYFVESQPDLPVPPLRP